MARLDASLSLSAWLNLFLLYASFPGANVAAAMYASSSRNREGTTAPPAEAPSPAPAAVLDDEAPCCDVTAESLSRSAKFSEP